MEKIEAARSHNSFQMINPHGFFHLSNVFKASADFSVRSLREQPVSQEPGAGTRQLPYKAKDQTPALGTSHPQHFCNRLEWILNNFQKVVLKKKAKKNRKEYSMESLYSTKLRIFTIWSF